MVKLFYWSYLSIFCFNCVNVYAGALDDLVNKKEAEHVAQEHAKQQKQAEKEQKAKFLEDITDCEQAVEKALEYRMQLSDTKIYTFGKGFTVNKDGFVKTSFASQIADFAKDGVFIRVYDEGWKKYFIYTKDTDYADNETFRETEFIYEKTGNYKYTATDGSTHSVPAFKATKRKVSDINPMTYIKNKNVICCQYLQSTDDKLKEIGIKRKTNWYDNTVEFCSTKNHFDFKTNGGSAQVIYFSN